jgi:N-acetyl-gamma-glutamyl-phosphate reductase
MTTWTAAVAGASGYAGGELLRILDAHPHLDLVAASAGTKAGRTVASVHPQLVGTATGALTLVAAGPQALAADVVFLALPHGQSAALVRDLPADAVVVDLGADHRLDHADDWTTYYGGSHAGSWPYGLPELPGVRARLAGATRIANPGCYPTAVVLALAPLLAAGLVAGRDIVVVAASGTSGAGRTPSDSLLGSEVMSSMSAYKAGGVHQHTPEIEQGLRAAAGHDEVDVLFTPTLAPMPRGILATCTARAEAGTTAEAVRAALHDAYAAEPFVHVLAPGQWPRTASVLGSNSVHLAAAVDPRTGRVTVVSAIDNLVKGAAGQAVQNANLALGVPETTGLPVIGVAP